MRLSARNIIATILVTAVIVPYVGYLVNGSMPFIQDPRGMSATGLVLGVAAFFTADRDRGDGLLSRVTLVLALLSLLLGVAALVLAETVAAEALLAVFIASIVATWAVHILYSTGVLRNRADLGAWAPRIPHRDWVTDAERLRPGDNAIVLIGWLINPLGWSDAATGAL